ncbi:hypothetical protein HK102_011808, partial [Quaeritorhiza haematococci]
SCSDEGYSATSSAPVTTTLKDDVAENRPSLKRTARVRIRSHLLLQNYGTTDVPTADQIREWDQKHDQMESIVKEGMNAKDAGMLFSTPGILFRHPSLPSNQLTKCIVPPSPLSLWETILKTLKTKSDTSRATASKKGDAAATLQLNGVVAEVMAVERKDDRDAMENCLSLGLCRFLDGTAYEASFMDFSLARWCAV